MEIELVSTSTVNLVQSNASDDMVAMAAWVSNGLNQEVRLNDKTRVEGLINFLYRNRHLSPFEHGSMTFEVDTPIFVAREFMRHRTFSYNETSGRYKELDPRFYLVPPDRPLIQEGKVGAYTFEAGSTSQQLTVEENQKFVFNEAWTAYRHQLSQGIAKEVARNVLPLATMTQFYATANPRNVMQFLTLRNDKHALKEIRDVAEAIEAAFAEAMPLTYNAYRQERDRERGSTLHVKKRKGILV